MCVCVSVCVRARTRLNCRHVLGRYLVRIYTGSSVIINDIFHNFSQLLQANEGAVPQLGHDRFLISPFLFIIQQLSYYRRYSYLQRRKTNHQKKVSVCESLAIAGAIAAFQISTKFSNSSLLLEVLCAAAWLPGHRSFALASSYVSYAGPPASVSATFAILTALTNERDVTPLPRLRKIC